MILRQALVEAVRDDLLECRRDEAGREQDRVHAVADQFGIHPRQVTIALGYAADIES